MADTRVLLQAANPLVAAGLASYLGMHPGIAVVAPGDHDSFDVTVVAAERFTAETVTVLRRTAATMDRPVVLIASDIDESQLLTAVECGVVSILPRTSVTPERLMRSVRAARNGGGTMSPRAIGTLLGHFRRIQREVLLPNGLTMSGLTSRELTVLRLLAEGRDTGEIAAEMRYSVRTVKRIICGVMGRYKLRNRSHAIAYAVRAGLI